MACRGTALWSVSYFSLVVEVACAPEHKMFVSLPLLKSSTPLSYMSGSSNVYLNFSIGRAMVQAVSLWPLISEARVCTGVIPSGSSGGQSGTGTCSSPSSLVFPVNSIPSWRSMLIYYLGDEQ
jgi:hypothetical protein